MPLSCNAIFWLIYAYGWIFYWVVYACTYKDNDPKDDIPFIVFSFFWFLFLPILAVHEATQSFIQWKEKRKPLKTNMETDASSRL